MATGAAARAVPVSPTAKAKKLLVILGLTLTGVFLGLGIISWGVSYLTDESPEKTVVTVEQSGNTSTPAAQATAPWPAERLISLKAGVKSEVIIFPTTYAPQWRIVGPGKRVNFFFNYESEGVLYDAERPQAEMGTKILSSAEMIAEEDTSVLFSFVR